MTKATVFDFKDYKEYLSSNLDFRSETERGQRSKLSAYIRCNPAYLSQVLNGPTDLSPEQAVATNSFLGHTPNESKYFLNLVLLSRAGTNDLKRYYEAELKSLLHERLTLHKRVSSNRTLTETDQAKYYSSWYFAAIHVAVSISHLRTRDSLSKELNLPLSTVNEVLEFLTQIGILKTRGNELRQGEVSLYLGSDSPFITKHHSNWRTKAIQSLDHVQKEDLHYSGVVTCSEQDVNRIKEIMIQTIGKIRETVKDSKDEALRVYTIDFFGFGK